MIANIEAEQQLLGAILTDNAVYHLVSEILTGEHFADPVHRRIFEICATRINAEKLASPVTLKTLMDGDDGLKAAVVAMKRRCEVAFYFCQEEVASEAHEDLIAAEWRLRQAERRA